jgi:hypothetical protein
MQKTLAFVLAAAAMGWAGSAQAQSRGDWGGGVILDVWEEPETTEQQPATPAPVPPPVVKQAVVIPAPPPKDEAKPIRPYNDRALNAVTRPELTRFLGESEFADYLRRLEKIRDRREDNWALGDRSGGIVVAAAVQDTPEPVCDDPEKCPDEGGAEIVTTASKSTPKPSITNNQTAGVDEGDIVKQIGDYFLVLQDGRIFAVNTRTMQLTDRADVYRRNKEGKPIGADWYDEMLVQGDKVLITAYSYDDSATELSVFQLDQASGKLARQGVFLISSDDYYSGDNYATRIVGDNLVMYTPYDLDDVDGLGDRKDRPVIRRWLGPEARKNEQDQGTPLIDASNIYWPVLRTSEPSLHTVTICPLEGVGKRDLKCRTTGFVGPQRAEMFVSPSAVYLWTSTAGEGDYWHLDPCTDDDKPVPRPAAGEVAPGVVYRLPIGGDEPSVLPIRGGVTNQFSLDEHKGRFRALATWRSDTCEGSDAPAEVALLDVSDRRFAEAYDEASGREFRPLPGPGKRLVENRFAGDWLVYGGRDGWGGYPPDAEDGPQSSKAFAVPLRNPLKFQVFEPGHQFIRIERVGDDMVLNGYRDDSGLMVSLLKLEDTARLGGQVKLEGRYESERRSHSFNATVDQGGGGLMGVPVVGRERQSGRWWWYSDVSDLTFLSFDRAGKLGDLGAVKGTAKDDVETHEGYDCEVSCIDWYGNARPIFTDGRVFALMATNLVEVEVAGGKVREKQRIDLTAPIVAK